MFRVFRTEWYGGKFQKLSSFEQGRIEKLEQKLKEEPFSGKPLGYNFFREKKFNGKRVLFLIYEEHQAIFLITITEKKMQQQAIDLIKANLDLYKEELQEQLKMI